MKTLIQKLRNFWRYYPATCIAAFGVGIVAISGCTTGTPVVTQTPSGPVTNTVYVPNTNAINSVAGLAQTGVAIASPLNPAIGPLGNLGVAWGTSIAFLLSGIVAAYKNQQNKNILAAVVQGVEGAAPTGGNDSSPITLAAVKQAIQTSATNSGVQTQLHAIVQANT